MGTIRSLTEQEYDQIIALSEFAFQYKLPDDDKQEKIEEMKRHRIWGAIEKGEIAAKLHNIPLHVTMYGKPIKMGGVSAVAAWPEHRRNGHVKQLMRHALTDMRESGQLVSYLHPFSVPFYRKFGYEIAFSKKEYTIPVERLKKEWGATGKVRRIKESLPVISEIYQKYAERYNGMLVRDKKWWEQRILAKAQDDLIAVCFNSDDKPEGYLMYHVKQNVFHATEMCFLSLNGQKLLLEFIANHDSMADEIRLTVPEDDHLQLLVDEPRFRQEHKPYFMARIVDVPGFLERIPFADNGARLVLHVKDAFLEENSGTYVLQNGKVTATEAPGEAGVRLDVQELASLLFGYRRPTELAVAGLIDGDGDSLKSLESSLPKVQTYLMDFF